MSEDDSHEYSIWDCGSSRAKFNLKLTCLANSLSMWVGSTGFNLETSSVMSISGNT